MRPDVRTTSAMTASLTRSSRWWWAPLAPNQSSSRRHDTAPRSVDADGRWSGRAGPSDRFHCQDWENPFVKRRTLLALPSLVAATPFLVDARAGAQTPYP